MHLLFCSFLKLDAHKQGYTGPDGTGPCKACAVGTYKDIIGSAACKVCPEGTDTRKVLGATRCI